MGKLVARNPDHVESHLARGRAALEARLWGEARRHLTAAAGPGGLDGNPSEAVCRLMAELAESERADIETSRTWLARAATAPPDPAWICGTCGTRAAGWRPRCGNCEGFDALAWTAPPHMAATPEIAAEPAPPSLAAPDLTETAEAPAAATALTRAP